MLRHLIHTASGQLEDSTTDHLLLWSVTQYTGKSMLMSHLQVGNVDSINNAEHPSNVKNI